MESGFKRRALLILLLLVVAVMCTSCSFYNTYSGIWHCEELGITFDFDDHRSSAYTAYGVMKTKEEKIEIFCSIAPGGGVEILRASAMETLYRNRKEGDLIFNAIAKHRNGKLIMRERDVDKHEYTGKVYIFERLELPAVRVGRKYAFVMQ